MDDQQTLIFRAPGQINGVRTLADGTVKLDVAVAKELPAEEMTVLFEARKSGVGWFLFSPNPIDEAAIPKEKAEASFEGKTPSQRLYNTLYVRWRELTNRSKPFDIYYQEQMTTIIDRLKSDLPERP
jgi:hypothetical protein